MNKRQTQPVTGAGVNQLRAQNDVARKTDDDERHPLDKA